MQQLRGDNDSDPTREDRPDQARDDHPDQARDDHPEQARDDPGHARDDDPGHARDDDPDQAYDDDPGHARDDDPDQEYDDDPDQEYDEDPDQEYDDDPDHVRDDDPDRARDAADFKTKSNRIREELEVLSSELLTRIQDLKRFKQNSFDIGQDGEQLRTFQEDSLTSLGKFNLYFTEFLSQMQYFIIKEDMKREAQETKDQPLSQVYAKELLVSSTGQQPPSRDPGIIKICDTFNTGHSLIWARNMTYVPSKNYLVTAGKDGYIEVHDVESKRQTKRFQAHNCEVMILRYIDTKETEVLLSAAEDGRIYLWDVNKDFEKLSSFTRHKDPVVALEYLPNLKLMVSGGEDRYVRVWAIHAEKEESQIKIKGERVTSICLLKRSKKMIVGNDGGWIIAFETSQIPRKEYFSVKAHSHEIMVLTAFKNGDHFCSGGRDGTIKVWRVDDKRLHKMHTLMKEEGMVRSIQIFEKRDLLISNHLDSKLRFWKLSTGNFLGELSDKTFGEAMVPLKNPNRFVTALHAKVNVWELQEKFDI